QMPAQLLGPASRNGPHHFLLTGRYATRSLVALPVLAKDIGQFRACFFLSCRQLMAGQQHDRAPLKRQVPSIEKAQGTGGGGEFRMANLQIAVGGMKGVMAQQCFYSTEVHSAL